MAEICIRIPEELKIKLFKHKLISWSVVAEEAFKQKLSDIEFLKQFKSESELTEQDALRIGGKINEKLSKRYLEE